jgi:hypothetical protein
MTTGLRRRCGSRCPAELSSTWTEGASQTAESPAGVAVLAATSADLRIGVWCVVPPHP